MKVNWMMDTHVHTEVLTEIICRRQIDISTTYSELFDVTDECLMYEFGMKHFPGYQPTDGFGYFKRPGSDSKSIPPHKKVILMDEVCKL